MPPFPKPPFPGQAPAPLPQRASLPREWRSTSKSFPRLLSNFHANDRDIIGLRSSIREPPDLRKQPLNNRGSVPALKQRRVREQAAIAITFVLGIKRLSHAVRIKQ